MKKSHRFAVVSFCILLIGLLVTTAQPVRRLRVGEVITIGSSLLDDTPKSWTITTGRSTQITSRDDEVERINGLVNPQLKIRILKSGIYIITLTIAGSEGCTNSKSLVVETLSLHPPLAVDDNYTFMDASVLELRPLKNDIDPGNDLNMASLSIIGKSTFGKTEIRNNGVVLYYPDRGNLQSDSFTYSVCDSSGACSTARVLLHLKSVSVWPVEGFSPDGDGINDRFTIRGIENFPDAALTVYTRSGQPVYSQKNYQNQWDGIANTGSSKNLRVSSGTYYYILSLDINHPIIKGFVYLTY